MLRKELHFTDIRDVTDRQRSSPWLHQKSRKFKIFVANRIEVRRENSQERQSITVPEELITIAAEQQKYGSIVQFLVDEKFNLEQTHKEIKSATK